MDFNIEQSELATHSGRVFRPCISPQVAQRSLFYISYATTCCIYIYIYIYVCVCVCVLTSLTDLTWS